MVIKKTPRDQSSQLYLRKRDIVWAISTNWYKTINNKQNRWGEQINKTKDLQTKRWSSSHEHIVPCLRKCYTPGFSNSPETSFYLMKKTLAKSLFTTITVISRPSDLDIWDPEPGVQIHKQRIFYQHGIVSGTRTFPWFKKEVWTCQTIICERMKTQHMFLQWSTPQSTCDSGKNTPCRDRATC